MTPTIGQLAYGIRNYRGHRHIQKGFISEIYYLDNMSLNVAIKHVCRGELGKTVFLTYNEAEKALKSSYIKAAASDAQKEVP